jgi:hypothetical protein
MHGAAPLEASLFLLLSTIIYTNKSPMPASAYMGATRTVGVVVSPQHIGDRPTDFVYARLTAISVRGRVCILARPPFKATR